MASIMENVWRQALITFGKKVSMTTQSFEENFATLKLLADRLTAADVKLDNSLLDVGSNCGGPLIKRKPPVTYIEIYEDNNFTIGIFILKPGVKIPLHDHPQMHGILKVISGTIKIQSYTVIKTGLQSDTTKDTLSNKNILLAKKLPEIIVNETNRSCVLTPSDRNVHEILSVNGPAAFLDILGPPYDSDTLDGSDRSCHYFQEMSKERSKEEFQNNTTRLFHIPSPPEFWSDSAPYKGPTLRL